MSSYFNDCRHVVACIPYFRCPQHIERAVKGLLAQTHKDLSVVVINDADFNTPPWPMLANIDDPRLFRFELEQNKGPYFATQVLISVTRSPYFLIQDADDWSHPQRVALLLNSMIREKSDFAVSGQPQVIEYADRTFKIAEMRWVKNMDYKYSKTSNNSSFHINRQLDSTFRYRSPHHGLFRTEALRNIGGYNPNFRINYDCLVPNLILMAGKITHVPEPLYHRFILRNSLTNSEATGTRSKAALVEKQWSSIIYQECYRNYVSFLKGHLSCEELLASIRHICLRQVNKETKDCLQKEVRRFKNNLTGQY